MQQQVETRFFFAIDAKVGLAYDTLTGEGAPTYVAVTISTDTNPSSEAIKRLQGKAINNLCTHLDIPPTWIQPISEEAYNLEMTEDEGGGHI